jgi:mannose-6-phosphate isomerase-like protein (cupin superfamily)
VSSTPSTATRLVVLGEDDQGRSTVVRDDVVEMRVDRPKGSYAEELWRQDSLPVRVGDDGTRSAEFTRLPPENGFTVRKFAFPANSGSETLDLAALREEFGADNLTPESEGLPVLHRHPALHVITVLSGSMYFVVRSGDVLISQGDCMILPGTMHDWRNPFDEPCVLLSTISRLVG